MIVVAVDIVVDVDKVGVAMVVVCQADVVFVVVLKNMVIGGG